MLLNLRLLLDVCTCVSLLTAVTAILRKKEAISIIFLIIAGLCLRVHICLDPYLHLWDERFHALVAKHLINHPLLPTLFEQESLHLPVYYWSQTTVWLHKPPLALWFMALSLKVFGINEVAVRLPSIIFSTASRIPTDHIDVAFFFFIELAMVFAVLQRSTDRSEYIIPLAISMSAAIYTKWLPALIVLPVWWVLNDKKSNRKNLAVRLLIICSITFLMVMPWQIYIYSSFPVQAH